MAQFTRGKYPVFQVANDGFAMNIIRIRLGVPRADKKPSVSDQLFQPLAVLRIDGQEIFHDSRLAVEVVTGIRRVLFQGSDHIRKIQDARILLSCKVKYHS